MACAVHVIASVRHCITQPQVALLRSCFWLKQVIQRQTY